MLLLAILLAVFALALGAAVLVVLWPLSVLAWAVLYCVDRPVRRRAWPMVVIALLAAAAAYRISSWAPSPGVVTWLVVAVAPLVLGAALILACGGPARIRARHARAEAIRQQQRAERRRLRRSARKAAVKDRTGIDVDLVAEVSRDRAGRVSRAIGSRLTRRLERHRRSTPTTSGPPEWLDLDRDVSADLSQQQRGEILDLATELERSRDDKPRPHR